MPHSFSEFDTMHIRARPNCSYPFRASRKSYIFFLSKMKTSCMNGAHMSLWRVYNDRVCAPTLIYSIVLLRRIP